LSSKWEKARGAAEHASLALAAAQQVQNECELRAAQARARREAVFADAERRDLAERRGRQQAEIDRLAGNLTKAQSLTVRTQMLSRDCAESAMTKTDLDALRQAEQELAQKTAQQQSVATQVRYHLSEGQRLMVDGVAVAGEGLLSVVSTTEIDIASVGRLTIEPGGRDLPAIAAAIDSAERTRNRLLVRMGVSDAREAEARWVAYDRAQRDLDLAKKELALHAPAGIDSLRAQHDDAVNHLAVLVERLQALPAPEVFADAPFGFDGACERTSNEAAPSLEAVTRIQEQADDAFAKARDAVAAASARADTTRALAHALQSQFEPLAQALLDSAEEALREQRQVQLTQAVAVLAALSRRVDDARATLAAHRPELAQQDVQRFDQSARIAREAHRARQGEILQLQGRLEQAGASGVGERLVDAQATHERAARRAAELGSRAAGLHLLATLLQEQRQAATRRLAAPLAQRLRHYVPILFPAAELRLDETLAPAALARGDVLDTLESLSFGTREQLGVLARLAYADLLQQAGRPTLIVLDDALVHTDDARREFMKRALFDAASRHQILMFTCHGDAWQDLGVAPRKLQ
jgi:hypothetical protein